MAASALLASTAIVVLSLVSEDAATVSSALSLFGGPLIWPLGFASCFIGIWAGDLGLYALARCLGRPVLRLQWVARFVNPASIVKCEQTISRSGTAALLVSRFVPGTRLPTYLAAGLFRMPAQRFALVTAVGAFVWIATVFAIAKLTGISGTIWLTRWHSNAVAVMVVAVCLVTALIFLRRLIRRVARRVMPWEFWPAWLFYLPVALNYVWLAIKHRSFTLPTAANPGIATGGFIGESKVQILEQLRRIDNNLVADAYLLDGGTPTDRLLSLHRICRERDLKLPFILKPDVGQRGNGVRLIRQMREALDYLAGMDAPVMVQRYAPGPHEAGVFYYRHPCETKGHVFSITDKVFPTITGDGIRTIEKLIRADERASLIAKTYLRRFDKRRAEVLPWGEVLKLVETGNHAQGCIFRDGAHLWSEALASAIDDFARKIPGFYVGRFDIRYADVDAFRRGHNFMIVELNGASSEATNIYDARYSLRSAYATLRRQWNLVFEIGAANRNRGYSPNSLLTLWREWRSYSAINLCYPSAS
jgi:membrane protein DedA with SNARE-associated domain